MRQSVNQIVFAALLLFVGILLLLLNVGVISLEIKQIIVESYPFIFLLLSFLFVLKALKRQNKGSLFWGFYFFSLCLMLCLDRLQLISFQLSDFWKLWPVIIIYFGLRLLVKKDKVKVIFHSDNQLNEMNDEDVVSKVELIRDEAETNIDKKKRVFSIGDFSIGDIELKKSNWSLEPLNLYNSIGDYFIDFSKAYIPEKETPVVVKGWIGDVKMIVPDDVPVKVEAKVKIGDIRIFDLRSSDINGQLVYKTPGYEESVKKLNITIVLKIGSVRIDKV